ncbi:Arc family DNA-binding protein [Pandoraea sp. SD6-2]|uniref:Arc family DNA-binding protein n=1 Tax=Pandoraea sp. SD6-2 TaxID=1286093 RepID=UPI0003301E38|nr:Arc family DNA-binding protein [Pandoraea sp. SD6-2]EON15185.1 Arc domain-containing protein [Pandoraea sp. SD6-2]EON15186.1 Arc domain-containing protein [Pandoraea sp. SD6-2]
MEKKPYPSETQERFIVRLPDGLRDRIAETARRNGRSMNSEIVACLLAAYPEMPRAAGWPTLDDIIRKQKEVAALIEQYSAEQAQKK